MKTLTFSIYPMLSILLRMHPFLPVLKNNRTSLEEQIQRIQRDLEKMHIPQVCGNKRLGCCCYNCNETIVWKVVSIQYVFRALKMLALIPRLSFVPATRNGAGLGMRLGNFSVDCMKVTCSCHFTVQNACVYSLIRQAAYGT